LEKAQMPVFFWCLKILKNTQKSQKNLSSPLAIFCCYFYTNRIYRIGDIGNINKLLNNDKNIPNRV